MPTSEQYEQINTCLYQVSYVLKKIGISEFGIHADKRYVEWDTDQEIDQELLNKFCTAISNLYKEP